MQKYYPLYYDKFSCIADKCTDSCCKDWEIVIDNETYNNYLLQQGDIGERIRSRITTDEDGDKCFSLIEGRCPFLNSDGLCEIHIKLGENMTSRICRDHPRIVEEYDGFTEVSLSLSCPEAAKIIVSSDVSVNYYPKPSYNGEDELLKILIDSRGEILANKKEFFESINDFSKAACRDEMHINLFYIDEGYFPALCGIKKYIKRLKEECEILSLSWKSILSKSLEYEISDDAFCDFIRHNEKQLLNIFYYYVYRYYLKAICDSDVYSRFLFIIYSVFSSAFIAQANSVDVLEAARLYSKEIEHSTQNFDILYESICEY